MDHVLYIDSSSCNPCICGTIGNATGSSSCYPCYVGSYSSGGASICIDCFPGTYSLSGSSSCIDCVAGTFASANQSSFCQGCPVLSTSPPKSSSCSCSVGIIDSFYLLTSVVSLHVCFDLCRVLLVSPIVCLCCMSQRCLLCRRFIGRPNGKQSRGQCRLLERPSIIVAIVLPMSFGTCCMSARQQRRMRRRIFGTTLRSLQCWIPSDGCRL